MKISFYKSGELNGSSYKKYHSGILLFEILRMMIIVVLFGLF